MPKVRRSRSIAAPQSELWGRVSDPGQLPAWWPRVIRVEGISGSGDRFTEVLRTDAGRDLRADFTVLEREKPVRWRFAQELGDDPFGKVLRSSETLIELDGSGGATLVTIEVSRQLRGMARLGGFLFRGATRRHIDEALETLEELHGGR
ncbi:MAG: SRPBCC family protein [Acidobacteria bacterium]|nr:SRPBCC family protein [Acidobacteriota bacterium]